MSQIDRKEGRRLFGADPAAYDRARPGHSARVYELLIERCGLGPGSHVLEIGPGTGQATRRLLELGASPLVALEPDSALAAHLRRSFGGRIEVRSSPLEDAELAAGAFDLAVAASCFHWIDEDIGFGKIHDALRPRGWLALWWTLFGIDDERDAFIEATSPLLEGLTPSPSHGTGGVPFALDREARFHALRGAGFDDLAHETMQWSASWDTAGIRALYGTFSPIARLDDDRRSEILDGVARIAEHEFGGHVERTLVTSLYTARKPP